MSPAGTDAAVADPSPSMGDAMDSFFSESTSPAPDAGAPPDPGADPGAGAPPEPEPAAGADLADAPAPAGQPAGAPPAAAAAPELPEGATLDGKQIRIDVPRFNNIYRDYKFAQEVRNIVPDLQTAQQLYGRATDFRHMHADFASGNADRFLDYWQKESPDGFSAMAGRMLERAPEAVRQQFADQAVKSHFDALYAKAAETGDAQDLYKARMAEYWATGDYRKDNAARPDPLAARERSLAERETRLKNQESQRAEQTRTNWSNQTYSAISTSLMEKVDQVLAPIKDRFTNAPDLFNALRDSIKRQAIQGVEADQEWRRNFNLDFQAAQRTMSPGDRQALIQQYIARVDRILTGKAAPLIRQASASLVQQNQADHQRLAAGSARRGAAAPGAPVRTSVSNGQRDRSGMSLEDKIDADMAL